MCKAECSDIEGDDRCQRKSVTSSVGRNYIRRRRVIPSFVETKIRIANCVRIAISSTRDHDIVNYKYLSIEDIIARIRILLHSLSRREVFDSEIFVDDRLTRLISPGLSRISIRLPCRSEAITGIRRDRIPLYKIKQNTAKGGGGCDDQD